MELQSKVIITLVFTLIVEGFFHLNVLVSNQVESKKCSSKSITILLAFIIARVTTFTEIFISPYGFELLSDVLSFSLGRRNLEHFLQGRSSGHRLPQLLLIWSLNFSFSAEGKFCQMQDSWLTVVFFQNFECIGSQVFGPPSF